MIKLTKKDASLLTNIDFQARLPATKLGKLIGLSPQGTEYKLDSLLSRKIILSYYPVINISRLGYQFCRLFLKLHQTTPEIEKEIEEYLMKQKKIGWIMRFDGAYDLGMIVYTKSITEFIELTRDIQFKYGKYIREKFQSIGTKISHYSHRFDSNAQAKEIILQETQTTIIVDVLDAHIIELLCKNARTTLVSMAEQLKKDPRVIAYRIKELERKQIILGYRPALDYQKVGYQYYKVFMSFAAIDKERYARLLAYIKANKALIYLVEALSSYDLDMELLLQDEEDYFHFITDLKHAFPGIVNNCEKLIGRETLKITYFPSG